MAWNIYLVDEQDQEVFYEEVTEEDEAGLVTAIRSAFTNPVNAASIRIYQSGNWE